MRVQQVYIETDHWDTLAKYYNENHDDIREKGFRNFNHWLGHLVYKGYNVETYPILRLQSSLKQLDELLTLGLFISIIDEKENCKECDG